MTGPSLGPLAGRTALVTGASRGIGAAVARRLARSGARLALLARGEEMLRSLATEIGGDALLLPCDVSSPQELALAIATIQRDMEGGPDIVVNNAAAFLIARAADTSVEAFRSMLEVNLAAPFALVHDLLPGMRARGHGHIVTLGSIADRNSLPGNAAYSASKHGLRALHEVLRGELRGSGVRASLVSPGPVDTELWDAIDPDNQPGYTPRASMLTPDAVADAVHYVLTAPETVNVDELRLSHS